MTDDAIPAGMVDARARVAQYIADYEDAPSWGGPTMYPAPPSLADLRLLATPAPSIVTGSDERAREGLVRDLDRHASAIYKDHAQSDLWSTLICARDALAASRPTDAGAGDRIKEYIAALLNVLQPFASAAETADAANAARELMDGAQVFPWNYVNPTHFVDAFAIFSERIDPDDWAILATPKPPVDGLQAALIVFAACARELGDEVLDDEWAKFRLLASDYRRAYRLYVKHFGEPPFLEDALAALRNLTGDGAGV